MSTKIYHGYRAGTDGTFVGALHLVSQIRSAVEAEHRQLVLSTAASLVALTRDAAVLGDEVGPIKLDNRSFDPSSPIEIGLYLSKLHQSPQRHSLDFDCKASLHIDPGGSLSQVFLIGFFGPEAYDLAFLSVPDVHEYRYWDNADQPEDVSEDDWRQRAEVWGRVLGPSWTPSKTGLVAELVEETAPLEILLRPDVWQELVASAPSEEDRALAAARQHVLAKSADSADLQHRATELVPTVLPLLPPVNETYLRHGEP
jgi:hypothetical protein